MFTFVIIAQIKLKNLVYISILLISSLLLPKAIRRLNGTCQQANGMRLPWTTPLAPPETPKAWSTTTAVRIWTPPATLCPGACRPTPCTSGLCPCFIAMAGAVPGPWRRMRVRMSVWEKSMQKWFSTWSASTRFHTSAVHPLCTVFWPTHPIP